jgi:hypothetical protein
MKKPGQARKNEKKMLKAVFEEALKWEKCNNNAWFMGELWKAGSIGTDTPHECIYKFLNDADDLSMNCLCALLITTGDELEENNENLSEYFSMIEDICESWNGVSSAVKHNLQDVIKFRQQNWIWGKYQYPKTDYTQKK